VVCVAWNGLAAGRDDCRPDSTEAAALAVQAAATGPPAAHVLKTPLGEKRGIMALLVTPDVRAARAAYEAMQAGRSISAMELQRSIERDDTYELVFGTHDRAPGDTFDDALPYHVKIVPELSVELLTFAGASADSVVVEPAAPRPPELSPTLLGIVRATFAGKVVRTGQFVALYRVQRKPSGGALTRITWAEIPQELRCSPSQTPSQPPQVLRVPQMPRWRRCCGSAIRAGAERGATVLHCAAHEAPGAPDAWAPEAPVAPPPHL
jgi:hypothetical protein